VHESVVDGESIDELEDVETAGRVFPVWGWHMMNLPLAALSIISSIA
jgi:hypothetical protein